MKKYNWNAKDYEEHSQVQQKWARELIVKLNLSKNEDVLDIGCGDGKVTVEIAHLVRSGSVVGIDSSPEMILLASERYPAIRHPNLSFILMDVMQLSFEEEFDLIFSNAALHWVHNHPALIKLLYNALRPGGRILLQMGGRGNAEDMFCVASKLQRKKEWQEYFTDFEFPWSFLGPEEYFQWLEETGFTVKRVELIPKDMVQDSPADLKGWIRTTWLPYLERIPEVKKEKFVNELVESYSKAVPVDSNGKIHMSMVRLEVEAAKKI